jgi:hypothetical protein
MIDPEELKQLKAQVAECVIKDRGLLDELLGEVEQLRQKEQRIQPRSTTSVSVVGTDGGNNELRFDPFMVQVVRIVDSNRNQLWLEIVSPTTPVAQLDARHLAPDGAPLSPLGRMMVALKVSSVNQLSPVIRDGTEHNPRSPSWTNVYRELTEWAVLLDLTKKDYGSDTLIIFDGFLRSKIFKGTLFRDYGALLHEEIKRHKSLRRNVYVVGLAKHSAVLTRYRLALKLKRILRSDYPAYVAVPRELEQKAYVWSEYARGRENEGEGEAAKFVNGKMFLIKFGNRTHDPIWPVDLFEPQADSASQAFGYLVQDAVEGFPVALYPRSLQKAHEAAALVGLDMDFLQDVIVDGVRDVLGEEARVLDEFALEPSDPAQARYG